MRKIDLTWLKEKKRRRRIDKHRFTQGRREICKWRIVGVYDKGSLKWRAPMRERRSNTIEVGSNWAYKGGQKG